MVAVPSGASTRPDSFLSEALGKPVSWLELPSPAPDSLSQYPCNIEADEMWCTKINVGDYKVRHLLQSAGLFDFVCENYTFKGSPPSPSAPEGNIHYQSLQPNTEVPSGDRDRLLDLATTSFRSSRFHADPHIEGMTADLLKRQWLENFFYGFRGSDLLVARDGTGCVCGFCLVLARNGRVTIDLIAVSDTHRKSGIARGLLGECGHFGDQLIVGTQVTNLAAVNLYTSVGMRVSSVDMALHHHFDQRRV